MVVASALTSVASPHFTRLLMSLRCLLLVFCALGADPQFLKSTLYATQPLERPPQVPFYSRTPAKGYEPDVARPRVVADGW